MENKYPELFKPFKIGKLEIKNRICMAPMLPGGWLDEDKNLTNETIAYYTERAKGGAGLIITGASFPNAGLEITDFTRSPFAKPAMFNQQTRKLVDSCHRYGAKVFVQMQLGVGRTGVPMILEGPPVAPSAVPDRYVPEVTCRELTTEECYKLIDAVVECAVMSKAAGADGINVNGVKGGYLGDQFAIEAFNHRTDEFGGSLEGRARLLTEIVKRIKEVCGPDFPVTTRIGTKSHMKAPMVGHLPGEEYQEYGRDVEESLELAKLLENAGYDGVVFGTGTYDSIYWLYPPMYMPDNCYLEEVGELQKVLNIPVICPGKISDPAVANEAIKNGTFTALGIGRGLVADPEWANKVKCGKEDDIRPCIACNNGCISRVLNALPMQCAVNPDVFAERDMACKYAKVENPKEIAIIGGGIAGMEAARTAATRGHKVTIYEKTGELGGLMLPSEVPDFKKLDRRLLNWYKKELARLNVEIKFNCEMDVDAVNQLSADDVIVATGSTARTLPVEGGEKAATASDVLLNKKAVGDNVVLVGGGQVGCETAIWLADQGKKVTVVESLPTLIAGKSDPIPQPNRDMLLELLIFKGIKTLTSTTVKEVTDSGVLVTKEGEETLLPCDDVVVSIGYISNNTLYKELAEKTDKKVWLIGDAQQPINIMYAIRDGSAIGALV